MKLYKAFWGALVLAAAAVLAGCGNANGASSVDVSGKSYKMVSWTYGMIPSGGGETQFTEGEVNDDSGVSVVLTFAQSGNTFTQTVEVPENDNTFDESTRESMAGSGTYQLPGGSDILLVMDDGLGLAGTVSDDGSTITIPFQPVYEGEGVTVGMSFVYKKI